MKPILRMPTRNPAYRIAMDRQGATYPYMVKYHEVLNSEVSSEDIFKARLWAEKNLIEYEWNEIGVFFQNKEDATLFKMGTWVNESY